MSEWEPVEVVRGRAIAAAMRLHIKARHEALGTHPVCEGVFFVTNPDTMKALEAYAEEFMELYGIKVRTIKQPPHPFTVRKRKKDD